MHNSRWAWMAGVAVALVGLCGWWPCPATAQSTAEDEPAAAATNGDVPATIVWVGVYVNQIHEVSLKENHFTADFYVWFRWQGEAVKPLESFEVVNGRIDSKDKAYETMLGDENYAVCRVVTTITEFWDVSRFPLNNHELLIQIEDGENEAFKLRFVADTENCGFNPQVQTPGWELGQAAASVSEQQYKTNYGDTSLPTGNASTYSRFVYGIPLERRGYGYFLKLFFGLFVATAISFLAFFIRPTEVDPRFGLGVGAIFAAVASEYVVTASLPDTNIMTMADQLHLLAFVFIFLSICEST
ncbi:MAG: hypothetical protein AB7O62_14860, partial [Pirellulales bacterium]